MNRFATPLNRVALIAAASMLLLAAAAYAQDPQTAGPRPEAAPVVDTSRPAAPAAAAPAAPEAETRAPAAPAARPVSPMMAEMQAVLATEAGKLVELRQRAREAATPDAALAVQRDIEKLKFETEVSLLRVQARHARSAGRVEVATRIESAIADLLNPPRPLAPAARPIPSREDQPR